MKAILWIPLFLLCVLVCAADDKKPEPKEKDKAPAPKLPIGKDTTYATGPLDKYGYIDYEAALNERLSKGIKPEQNANVLLWKAFGNPLFPFLHAALEPLRALTGWHR